jgi:GNAT superfamily N-acetyltransferase
MLEIRPADSDEDLGHVARIVTAVTPDSPSTVELMRWQDAHYPGGQRYLAWLDGEPVGAGGAGRVYMYPPEFEGLWGNLSVLEPYRGRGIGSALLASLSDLARSAGKTKLMGRTTADRPESIAFLENRGFEEHDRMKVVQLPLAGLDLPEAAPPAGIAITSLADRPELVGGVYEVALEALPDIPGGPIAPLTLDEFRVRDVDAPNIPHGGFAIGVEAATGRVAGYASLMLVPGRSRAAWHGMTAVARAWRGRGLATALKRATIAWAIEHDLEVLEGANDVANAPMRAVNARLGYQPAPDEITFLGPLTPHASEERTGAPGQLREVGV